MMWTKEEQREFLRVTGTKGIDSAEGLKARIAEYVDWKISENGQATKLQDLNSRFGVLARKHGTTVRDLIEELMESNQVHLFSWKRGVMILTETFIKDLIKTQSSPAERNKRLDEIFAESE